MGMEIEDLADVIATAIDEAVEPLVARNKALEARVAELEARPSLLYKGTFQYSIDYPRGSCVTHRGSLWIAVADTHAQPGLSTDESRAWVLAVKSGRDGRDSRKDNDDER